MNRGWIVLALIVAATFVLPQSVRAEEDMTAYAAKPNRVGGNLGYFMYLEGSADDFNNVGIKLQYERLGILPEMPNLGITGGLMYTSAEKDYGPVTVELSNLGLYSTALIHIGPPDLLHFYGGGGLGIFMVEAKASGCSGPFCATASQDETDIGVLLQGGVVVPMPDVPELEFIGEGMYGYVTGDIDADFLFLNVGANYRF